MDEEQEGRKIFGALGFKMFARRGVMSFRRSENDASLLASLGGRDCFLSRQLKDAMKDVVEDVVRVCSILGARLQKVHLVLVSHCLAFFFRNFSCDVQVALVSNENRRRQHAIVHSLDQFHKVRRSL